jgi:hypothetical protein
MLRRERARSQDSDIVTLTNARHWPQRQPLDAQRGACRALSTGDIPREDGARQTSSYLNENQLEVRHELSRSLRTPIAPSAQSMRMPPIRHAEQSEPASPGGGCPVASSLSAAASPPPPVVPAVELGLVTSTEAGVAEATTASTATNTPRSRARKQLIIAIPPGSGSTAPHEERRAIEIHVPSSPPAATRRGLARFGLDDGKCISAASSRAVMASTSSCGSVIACRSGKSAPAVMALGLAAGAAYVSL